MELKTFLTTNGNQVARLCSSLGYRYPSFDSEGNFLSETNERIYQFASEKGKKGIVDLPDEFVHFFKEEMTTANGYKILPFLEKEFIGFLLQKKPGVKWIPIDHLFATEEGINLPEEEEIPLDFPEEEPTVLPKEDHPTFFETEETLVAAITSIEDEVIKGYYCDRRSQKEGSNLDGTFIINKSDLKKALIN